MSLLMLNHQFIACKVIPLLYSPALDHELVDISRTARWRGNSVPTVYHFNHLKQNIPSCSYILLNQKPVDICSLPWYCYAPGMVCVPDSIPHTSQLHSSTHHWQWNTSWNAVPIQWWYMPCAVPIISFVIHEQLTSGAVHLTGIIPPRVI